MDATQNTRDTPEVISYRTIRRSIGYLGILLAPALFILSHILGCRQLQPSISHYYYTMSGSLLVGTLCAVGLFLISYKGFGPIDDRATNIAGVFAFGVAFFPTGNYAESMCAVFKYPDSALRGYIHFGSAALLFITLAYISFFLFTISKGVKTRQKISRNRVYRTCAVLMIFFIAMVPVFSISAIKVHFEQYCPTFWMETGALVSFGISWLVKGEVILEDKPPFAPITAAHPELDPA